MIKLIQTEAAITYNVEKSTVTFEIDELIYAYSDRIQSRHDFDMPGTEKVIDMIIDMLEDANGITVASYTNNVDITYMCEIVVLKLDTRDDLLMFKMLFGEKTTELFKETLEYHLGGE